MLDATKLEQTFLSIAGLAQRDGTEVELLVESGESLRLSVNEGKIEKFDSSQANVGGLRVILNGVEGYCWTESLASDDLQAAYAEALENAKFASRGRSEAELQSEAVQLYAASVPVLEDPSLFNETISQVPMDEKIDRAMKIESLTKATDARISSVPYNSYGESAGEFLIFNTRGVRARQRRTSVSGYAYCLAKQGDESRMAGESFFTRDATKDVSEMIDEVAKSAAEKALMKLGASSPETGRYPIVIDREVAAELFGLISGYFSAKSVAQKTSIFAEDIGKAIASPILTVVDDPSLDGGIGNRTFDAEGAPAKKTELIRDGVLTSFLTNSVYARKLSLPHTASASRSAKGELDVGPSNIVVAPGADSLQALLEAYPKLIYVTNFTGYHAGFREGSGEFGFQSQGELYENGKRVKALCNFVVAGSIRELLSGVEKVSSRLNKRVSTVVAPDLLIGSLSVAGA